MWTTTSCDRREISERVQKALDLDPIANSREMIKVIKESHEISAMLQGLTCSIESRREK